MLFLTPFPKQVSSTDAPESLCPVRLGTGDWVEGQIMSALLQVGYDVVAK